MARRFWTWLGTILSDKQHPLTSALADCMRFMALAVIVGAGVGVLTWTGVDDFGSGETRSTILSGLLGAGAAEVRARLLKRS